MPPRWSARLRASRNTLLVVVAACVLLAGCGGDSAPSGAAGGEITDVDGIEPIREEFNRDAGSPRLLVLFAPT
jgi:hypothetical protein